MKKIILFGIVVGIINLILGTVVSYLFMLFPAVSADYNNSAVMRAWSDPLMSLFFVYPFIQGIILAWVWDMSKTLFHGTLAGRGTKFGLAIWLISTIPGMWMSYTCFPLSFLTIVSWTVGGFVTAIAAGIILARINK